MRSLPIPSILLSVLSICNTITSLPTSQRREEAAALFPTARAALPLDFPDPSIIKLPDGYYAFATASKGKHIQLAKSNSFTSPSWQLLPIDPLPDAGAWTDHSTNIWAPFVTQTPSGTFVMYYSAPPSSDPTKHCIGTATSTTITGPYIPAPAPFVCDIRAGGAIDPSIFTDPTTLKSYVTYKIDGNSLGINAPTPIMLQQVSPSDMRTKIGPAVAILDQDPKSDTDGALVEAPTLTYLGGRYWLLYSTNDYTSERYDVRYVSATKVEGPYGGMNVLLKTGDGNGVVGPGSCDVRDGMIVFHGRVGVSPLRRDMYAGFVKASGATLKLEKLMAQ